VVQTLHAADQATLLLTLLQVVSDAFSVYGWMDWISN